MKKPQFVTCTKCNQQVREGLGVQIHDRKCTGIKSEYKAPLKGRN